MKLKLEPVIKLQKLVLHVCQKCKEVFKNSNGLKEHRCHYNKQFYKHAVSAYVAMERMQIHNCTESFKSKTDYLLHNIEHVQANVRKRRSIEKTATNGHILKPYKCPDCDIKFAAQSTLDLHSMVHMPYPHVCPCGVGYYKQTDLISHIKLVHGNHKTTKTKFSHNSLPFNTETIKEILKINKPILKTNLVENKKSFNNNNNVKLKSKKNGVTPKRTEIVKTNDNKYKCPVCNALFNSRASVILHCRVHVNKRVHSCYLCSEKTNTVDLLRLHVKEQHNTDKICVCRFCPNSYTNFSHRTRHERVHANDMSLSSYTRYPFSFKTFPGASRDHRLQRRVKKRGFTCDNCKLSFKSKCLLVTHILRRVCAKDSFECDYCHKKFKYKAYLRKHILNVHSHNKSDVGRESRIKL
ncbi:hypothetical protein HW555_012508 [Spodoptera exigua]|uniref:C2H2-type domain-containing protein n=1 Tax=Spodoptera exigua TaxID=7107 RepID=A0A835L3I5_SPOEX|nr:hypothetical protein HW555_012508 [Spodoptera exigua]